MRGVIGRDTVDGPVREPLDQRLDVAFGPERRGHLRVGVPGPHRVLRQHQVVRRHLGGDADAARLRVADEAHRARGGRVSDVDVGAGQLGQQDVARDHHVFGRGGLPRQTELGGHDALVDRGAGAEGRILGVADDRRAEGQRVLHGAAVEAGVHDAPAVVREGDAARFRELGQLGELLAAEIPCDGADRVDAHPALDPRLGQDVVGDRAVVVDGTRVRHAADGGETPGGGRAGAGRHGLLVFLAGLAQVHVHVDEPGADDLAGRVHDLGVGGRLEASSQPRDLAVLDEDVLDSVDGVRRVDDAAAPEQEAHAPSPPLRPARRSSTPMRTATPRG